MLDDSDDDTPNGGDTPGDDEALAEEWEATASDGDSDLTEEEAEEDEGSGKEDRVLSQDEIDSLLGGAAADEEDSAGIQFLINNSQISHERLPMLEVAFDRLVRNLSTSLRNFTSTSVDLNVDEMTSVRFGDYLDTVSLPCLLVVYRAVEWDSLFLLYVETNLVYTLVDALLGGASEKHSAKIEGRPFTTIERNLVKELVEIILQDYSAAFSAIAPVTFEYDRMETTPRFAAIVRPVDASIVVNLHILIDGRGGRIQFCIPYASLEPVREQILQMFMGEKSGQDNIWTKHLETEVWDAEVSIKAILGTTELSLGEVLDWEPGSRVELRTKPHSVIDCQVGGYKILDGKMGTRDHHIAVRIESNTVRDNIKSKNKNTG